MNRQPIFLNELGILCALGSSLDDVRKGLLRADSRGLRRHASRFYAKEFLVGRVDKQLVSIPDTLTRFACRNNQLLLTACAQIQNGINRALRKYGASRVGIVLGSSTSGIDEAEKAISHYLHLGKLPDGYHYKKQEIGASAEFLARYLGCTGPAYLISTACSSSAKVFSSGRGLIDAGICDAVIVGGVDSLCELTLNGFDSLEALSNQLCNPFSKNRSGINIGEGAAVFLMTKEPADIKLLGVGESSDAYHMSAPHPEGRGAVEAMLAALNDAELAPREVDYLNLHGTATQLNDAMESQAVTRVFPAGVAASSTKTLTGHTLGAAGAIEAGLCWLLLSAQNRHKGLPMHVYDGKIDPMITPIGLVEENHYADKLDVTMSNSFAFGGNNVSLILATDRKQGHSDD